MHKYFTMANANEISVAKISQLSYKIILSNELMKFVNYFNGVLDFRKT
jgi:hypothetical protein